MLRTTLKRGDGLTSGRPWLGTVVQLLQSGLSEAGFALDADGRFGSTTEQAVEAFQASSGLLDNGVVGKGTWAALDFAVQAVTAERQAEVQRNLGSFTGDLDWIHQKEGHRGRPYWPGGASGVTLDPGVDLGHQDVATLRRLYGELLTNAQLAELEQTLGVRGEAARALAESSALAAIRVAEEDAAALLPFAARPYWQAITTRFPSLLAGTSLPSIQTVLLSLAYNRGAENRHLEVLRHDLALGDWLGVGRRVRSMQQGHRLTGIRRRRREEGDLILAELEHLQA